MASDTSMPPSEAPTPTPTPADAPGDMATSAPQDGGSVMMQIPKEAFDAIHQLVIQLAGALDQAAQTVNGQAAQSAGAPSGMPTGAEQPPASPSAPEDDEDLANFAQELSNRSR